MKENLFQEVKMFWLDLASAGPGQDVCGERDPPFDKELRIGLQYGYCVSLGAIR